MNNDIKVYIKKGAIGADGVEIKNTRTPTSGGKTTPNENRVQDVIAVQMIGLTKQALSHGLNNYGAITGRHREQANIQQGINLAGMVATGISLGPVLGTAYAVNNLTMRGIENVTRNNLIRREIEFNTAKLGRIINDGGR